MNIVVKAVQEIMYAIPEEVLIEAFMKTHNNYRAPVESLENRIINEVIRKRVVPDANIAKGEHMTIKLGDIQPKYIEDYRSIYEIPQKKLLGKTIVSVLSVSYTPFTGGLGSFGYSYAGVGPMFSNDVMTANQQMVEASSAVPNVATAQVELIGENTIMIEDAQRYNTAYVLQCYVTDNNYLNKIDPRSFHEFAKLCELAVKSYIYRKLRVRMDRGQVEGGSIIGTFKEVVDEFADAEENYKTYLRENWAVMAFCDNRLRYRRYIMSQIPIGL